MLLDGQVLGSDGRRFWIWTTDQKLLLTGMACTEHTREPITALREPECLCHSAIDTQTSGSLVLLSKGDGAS